MTRSGGWKCRRCGQAVDMATFRCGCAEGPSPWEPVDKFGYMLKPGGSVVAEPSVGPRPGTAKYAALYWFNISDCVCDSLTPIGACLKCDMAIVIRTLDDPGGLSYSPRVD